jgi:hypothetical protein
VSDLKNSDSYLGASMSKENEIAREITQVMLTSLLQLQKLINRDSSKKYDFLSVVKTFLLGVVSTSVDLVEVNSPGSAPSIYADIEAAAKLGGLGAIKKMQSSNGGMYYSVSNIEPDDVSTAMNYLGQEMSAALFKGIHELPMSLRTSEMFLRGVEALLANLLKQKFNNSHELLDSFCEHVHLALSDLESSATH